MSRSHPGILWVLVAAAFWGNTAAAAAPKRPSPNSAKTRLPSSKPPPSKAARKAQLNNALVQAINGGNADRAFELLDAGADPNWKDADGMTVLMHAVKGKGGPLAGILPPDVNEDLVYSLIERGAKINARDANGSSALWHAITTRNAGLIEGLLKRKADPNVIGKGGLTPLMLASILSDLDGTKLLLAHGANVNAPGPERMSAMAFSILSETLGKELFVLEPRKSTLSLLLEHGGDLNTRAKDDYTLPMIAAAAGAIEPMRIMIEKKLDLNARAKEGVTALMVAVSSGKFAIMDMLLDAGVDPNAISDDGSTALMLAADGARYSMVERLLQRGAKINLKSADGSTALILAKRKLHGAIIAQLKAAGAAE